MAVRLYGKELNNLSTADFIGESKKKRGKYYKVERIISRRTRKRKNEYLVKWKGYGSLSNSWEPEENLNSLALRTFSTPNPNRDLVDAGIDSLHVAMLENLASKTTLPTVICFRHDVFNYLFNGKGTKSHNFILLGKEDFSRCSLPSEWDQLVDKLGDGVRITFPIKVRPFISQGPKSHTFTAGEIKESPRYNVEKLSVNCLKQAFSFT